MGDELSNYLRLRLASYEKSMKQLDQDIAWVMHKEDSIGLRSEKLAGDLKLYAGIETAGLKDALTRVGNLLIAQEDARLRMHDRYEFNFLPLLREMPLNVKAPREVVTRREKEITRLNKTEVNYNKECSKQPPDRVKCDKLNGDLIRLKNDVANTNQSLVSSIAKFETDKVANLKKSLGEYLHAQLMFHARSLETLTEAIDIIHSVDDESEIDEVLEKVNAAASSQARGPQADTQRAQVSSVSGAQIRATESNTAPRSTSSQNQGRTDTVGVSRPGRRHSRDDDFDTDEDADLDSDHGDEVQGFDSDDNDRRGSRRGGW